MRSGLSLVDAVRALRALRPGIVASINLPNGICGLAWRVFGAHIAIGRHCDVTKSTRFSPTQSCRALHSTPVAGAATLHERDEFTSPKAALPGLLARAFEGETS